MAFFKRLKEMARQSAMEGHLDVPNSTDAEGTIVFHWLDRIWSELQKDLKISEGDVTGEKYYRQVTERIRRDESLVFDGWKRGHQEVSYVKTFTGAEQQAHSRLERVQELLSMIDVADGNITFNKGLLPEEDEIKDLLPDGELERKIIARERHATRMAVRRDWLEEFAQAENRVIGIVNG